MAGDDFVMVQLSAEGREFTNNLPVRTSNGRRAFTFEPGVPQRVERSYEWLAILSRVVAPDGRSLFELAAASAAPPTHVSPVSAAVEEKK